jgi:hypothetical protein
MAAAPGGAGLRTASQSRLMRRLLWYAPHVPLRRVHAPTVASPDPMHTDLAAAGVAPGELFRVVRQMRTAHHATVLMAASRVFIVLHNEV